MSNVCTSDKIIQVKLRLHYFESTIILGLYYIHVLEMFYAWHYTCYITLFRLTETSTPSVILSCLLADLDLCLATSTKFSTSLVRVTLVRRLDGDFIETGLETVSEALVSLCPVENLPGAVVGLSHTTVHVW